MKQVTQTAVDRISPHAARARNILASLTMGAGIAVGAAPAAHAGDAPVMIVLDASGSMWGQIDGINKITIARDVINDVMRAPPTGPLGLIAYGHNRKGDCGDIELLVPAATGTAAQITSQVATINPKGKTPLTEAVKQAAQALRHSEGAATVVLVTDGLETCGADPCALARELEATGVDFTAHVVGFGLGRGQETQLACLAAETGGQYLPANNALELQAALSNTMAAAPAPAPTLAPVQKTRPANNLQINVAMTADSLPLEEGEIARLDLRLAPQSGGREERLGGDPTQSRNVSPGDYVLSAIYQGGFSEMEVTAEEFAMTHATLVLNAGRADIQALAVNPAFEIEKSKLSWRITRAETGKRFDLFDQSYNQVLGAGQYTVQAVVDRNPKSSPLPFDVNVIPGETVFAEVVLPNAQLFVKPVDAAGAAFPDSHIRYALHLPKDDGTPGNIIAHKAGGKDPVYPMAGNYLLVVTDWGIGKRELVMPIQIAAGAAMSVAVTLPTDPTAPMSGALR